MGAIITSLCTYDQSGPCDVCHVQEAWQELKVSPDWLLQHATMLQQHDLGNLLLQEQQFYFSDGSPSFKEEYFPDEDTGIVTFTLCMRDRKRLEALGLIDKVYEVDCT